MALFGRNKRGIDFPPQSSAVEQNGTHLENGEPIFRPKPESLDVSSLVEKAKAGESIAMVPALDEFFDGWIHYAQDRNVFTSSPSVVAFVQARRDAIALAGQKKFDELQTKLEELTGPLAAEVEAAADANIKHIQESRDATASEHKETLTSTVSEIQELQQEKSRVEGEAEPVPGRTMSERFANIKEQAPEERAALDAAEAAYLERFKEYHRTKGLIDRVKEKISDKEPEDLIELKNKYNDARVAYANALEASVARRLDERGLKKQAKILSIDNNVPDEHVAHYHAHKFDRANVMRRYNAMIRYKAVMEPATQKLYDARFEALGEREKGIFRKGFERWQKGNVWLEKKYGKRKARFIQVAGTTLVAGLGAGALGAFSAVGALGILGFGVKRFSRALFGSVLGAAAGEGAAQLYGKTRGKRKQSEAQERLAKQEIDARHGESHLTARELEEYDRTRLKLTKQADERTLEEKKMLIRVLTAFGVGAGTTAFLSQLPSADSVFEHGHGATHVSETHTKTTHVTSHTVTSHTVSRPHITHPAEVPVEKAHIDSVSVQGSVNNADKLFGRFVDNVRAQYPDSAHAPPALRPLLDQSHQVQALQPEDVLTKFFHLQNGGSVVVHPGDTLSYENGKVMFQGHTLIDEHGTVHDLHKEGLVDVKPVHPHVAPTAQHVEQTVTQETSQPVTQSVTAPQIPPQTPSVEAPQVPVEAPPVSPEHITPSAPEHVEPAPAPVPEHIEQPAPITTPAPAPEVHQTPAAPAPESAPLETGGPHIVPNEVPPVHEVTPAPAIEHPVPSNDNTPSLESTPPGINHEAFVNPHGVHIEPRAVHLYGVAEGRGKETLIAYGTPDPTSGKDFMNSISDLLKQNPNATVYFQSPTPTYINGVPQPWISSATLSPEGNVIVSVTPSDSNLVGVKINPETFTRVIN